jgi:hypothetical protein
MRLLFVADGRSAIALNWIRYFISSDHEVHLASSFPCRAVEGIAGLYEIPVAFSQFKTGASGKSPGDRGKGLWSGALAGMRTLFRQWLGPLTLPGASRQLRGVVQRVKPDLVHAMRIPYEGMLTDMALRQSTAAPWLVSIWGNDFTLHARSNPWMGALTRTVMHSAHGLHADCQRDIRLGHAWGYPTSRPSIVLPGGGGVQTDVFYPPHQPPGPMVINPRGFRAYVRNDTFFASIPQVLKTFPQARSLCVGMEGDPQAVHWVESLGISGSVTLLPAQTRPAMASLFRQARVAVSPTTHDGTPNTLLEAMACGCIPVAGDLESLREWIKPGENGLLFDPASAPELALATIKALQDDALQQQAIEQNTWLIATRAEYHSVMSAAEKFYRDLCR